MPICHTKSTNNDQRVIVILIFCVLVILMHSLAKNIIVKPGGESEKPITLIQDADTGQLRLTLENNSPLQESDINPELTPFFFAPVKVSSASKEMLMTLPGIGSGMADRIIEYRDLHGGIHSSVQFMQVRGIGEKRYAALRDHISFEL